MYANMEEQKKELRHAYNREQWANMDENKRKRDRSNAERRRINALDLNDEEGNIRSSEHMRRCYRKERWSGQVFQNQLD